MGCKWLVGKRSWLLTNYLRGDKILILRGSVTKTLSSILTIGAVLTYSSLSYANSYFGFQDVKEIKVNTFVFVKVEGTVIHTETCMSPGREHKFILNPSSSLMKEM